MLWSICLLARFAIRSWPNRDIYCDHASLHHHSFSQKKRGCQMAMTSNSGASCHQQSQAAIFPQFRERPLSRSRKIRAKLTAPILEANSSKAPQQDQKSSRNVWIKWSNWMNNKRTAPSSISGAKPPTKTVLCGFGTWVLSLQDFLEITCEFGLVCLSLWISLGNRSSKIMALTSSMSGSLTGGLRSDAIGSTVTAWPPKACRSGTSGPHSVCSHLTPWHLNGSSSYNRLAVDDI